MNIRIIINSLLLLFLFHILLLNIQYTKDIGFPPKKSLEHFKDASERKEKSN